VHSIILQALRAARLIKLEWALNALTLGLALALRLYHIDSQALWLDESYSWWDAEQRWRDLWNLVPECDPHPPLYFGLLKLWIGAFGDSTAVLRILSALLGTATCAIVILAGRELTPRIGWLAGVLFALTPFQIEFGREARPYSLLCFGAALLLWGGLRFARNAGNLHSSQRDLRLGAGAILLGGVTVLWTNDTSILMIVALTLACLIWQRFEPDRMRTLLGLGALIATLLLLWAPYLPRMLEQLHGVMNDFWIPRPEGWRVPNELRSLVSVSDYDAVWWAVAALAGGLVLIWRRGRRREAVLLGCLAILPVAFNYAISMLTHPIFIARAMIGVTPAIAVLLAAAACLQSTAALRYGAMLALFAAHVMALNQWRDDYQGKEPWDLIAKDVIAATEDDESHDSIVLLAANELALPLSHAFEDIHMPAVQLQGAPTNFPSPGLHARYPSGKCAPSVQDQDLHPLERVLAHHRHVYFITRTNNVYDPGNRISRFLQADGYTQTRVRTYMPGQLEIHEFVGNAWRERGEDARRALHKHAVRG
jgi:hypothetical protein